MAQALMNTTQPSPPAPPSAADAAGRDGTEPTQPPLTPALIREVTQKVYALWLHDMQIEHERLGLRSHVQRSGWRNR